MSHLQYFAYEGFGAIARKETHYSQAVRHGDIIEVSGQGGWDWATGKCPADDFPKETEMAFENVERALKDAGGKGWEQVYKVRCFLTPGLMHQAPHLVRNLQKYCPNHQPLLTCVAVAELAFENMHVEIEVSAHLGN